MALISYFNDEIEFVLSNEEAISLWINVVSDKEGQLLSDLNVIFTTDEKLLKINKQFLNHDYYTDVITFPGYGEVLSGEIFISVDRVKENAGDLNVAFEQELHRVILHGLLHILGYNDKSEDEILEMRRKEDFYLALQNT